MVQRVIKVPKQRPIIVAFITSHSRSIAIYRGAEHRHLRAVEIEFPKIGDGSNIVEVAKALAYAYGNGTIVDVTSDQERYFFLLVGEKLHHFTDKDALEAAIWFHEKH